MTRVVYLPALGRRVTLGQYVRAVKMAKANPAHTFPHGLTTWWPTTGAEVVAQFREGLADRINQPLTSTPHRARITHHEHA